jgi:DNA-binding transcriptional LysR family regulator
MAVSAFTIRQLEAFVAVAEASSFAAASERLGLTPSAVSQLVGDLEAIAGFRVFDRTTRRVTLSGAGRELIGSARSVIDHMRLTQSFAADIRNRAAGIVRVGAPQVLASAVLPAAIRAFTRERPKVVVRIRDTPVEALVDRLASGDLDLAVGPDRPVHPSVTRSTIFKCPWVLWCAPSHPLARRRSLRWVDLGDQPLVAAGRDHEVSVAQMRHDAPAGRAVVPVDVVDNTTTALGIAAQGVAATLAPAYVAVVARLYGLEMRRVGSPEVFREVSLYRPAQRSVPPAADAFGEFLTEWVGAWARKRPAWPHL